MWVFSVAILQVFGDRVANGWLAGFLALCLLAPVIVAVWFFRLAILRFDRGPAVHLDNQAMAAAARVPSIAYGSISFFAALIQLPWIWFVALMAWATFGDIQARGWRVGVFVAYLFMPSDFAVLYGALAMRASKRGVGRSLGTIGFSVGIFWWIYLALWVLRVPRVG
jgi:hypothetical protein